MWQTAVAVSQLFHFGGFNLVNLLLGGFWRRSRRKHPFSLAGQLCSSQRTRRFFTANFEFRACQIIFWITKVRSNTGGLPSRAASRPDRLQSQSQNDRTHTHTCMCAACHPHTHTRLHTRRDSFWVLMANISWLICLNVWTTESERDREIKTNDRDRKREDE